jgi:hypothetical protein
MKHLFILFIAALFGYFTWQLMDPVERANARGLLTKHGLRIGAILIVLAIAIYVATILPSTPLI